MYQMHPNAEILYLTKAGDTLFDTFQSIQGSSGGGGGGATDVVMNSLVEFKTKCPPHFNMLNIKEKIKDITPYNVVVLQEC